MRYARQSVWFALAILACVMTAGTAKGTLYPGSLDANVVYHIDADDLLANGAAGPADGSNVTQWRDQVNDTYLISNAPANYYPTYVESGIGGQPTVRFDSPASNGDLLYDNNARFTGQTFYAVLTMGNSGNMLSTLWANQYNGLTVRQTVANEAAYYPGNSADLVDPGSRPGVFAINGNARTDIPGGFGAPHVLKLTLNSPVYYNGFRLSENSQGNRYWNGDVSEILVFDRQLTGNDSARVMGYLQDKYGIAQVIDERFTDTMQVAVDPFADGGNVVAAVNFHHGSALNGATIRGIGFDDIDLTTILPYDYGTGDPQISGSPGSSYNLSANGTSAVLETRFGYIHTTSIQTATVTGEDAAAANLMLGDIHVISAPRPDDEADEQEFTLHNLTPNARVYVQMFGGDQGWNGRTTVTVNGSPVGYWSVSDANASTATTFGFFASADVSGDLDVRLDHAGTAPAFAGLSGLIVTERNAAAPTLAVDANLTSTTQVHSATVAPPFPAAKVLAGVNLHYGTQATGTVNGIAMDNINMAGGGPLGAIMIEANQPGLTVNVEGLKQLGDPTGRGSTAVFAGDDAATLAQITANAYYAESCEMSLLTHHPNSMLFEGLEPMQEIYVQLIGLSNGWTGMPEIWANDRLVGVWTEVTGDQSEASIAGFYTAADELGRLEIGLNLPDSALPYAAVGGVILLAPVPEPSTMILLGAGMLGILPVLRMRRRR